MEKIDEKTVELEGSLYEIAKSRDGQTCNKCSCYLCRSCGKLYAATCYRLIGRDHYLRRLGKKTKYDKRTIRED